jgi:hypothetical protein
MPHWELIDHNPDLGVRKYIAADEHEADAVLVKHEFDRDHTVGLIDQNKAAQNDASGPMGDMALAARIPISVMYDWLTKYGVNAWNPNHMDGVKKLLNSSDYRYLKVRNIII